MNARLFLAVPALLIAFCANLHAAGTTVLAALKAIPKPAAKNLARIEAFEGGPLPERWYFLTYDQTQPYGLREFAVEDGRVVANRTLSQFAEILQPTDVIGAQVLKTDTKTLVTAAEAFLVANKKSPGTFDFKFTRDPGAPDPVWKVNCIDAEGDQIGTLIISATNGKVLSHPGFEVAPDPTTVKPPTPAAPSPTATPATTTPIVARETAVRVGPEVTVPPRSSRPPESPSTADPDAPSNNVAANGEPSNESAEENSGRDPTEEEGGLRRPEQREEGSRNRSASRSRSKPRSTPPPSVFRRIGGKIRNVFD